MRFLPRKQLKEAINFLENQEFTDTTYYQKLNVARYHEVVNTFRYWLNMKDIDFKIGDDELVANLPGDVIARKITLLVLKEQMDLLGYENYPEFEKIMTAEQQNVSEREDSLNISLRHLAEQTDAKHYLLSHYTAICALQKIYFNDVIDHLAFEQKVDQLRAYIQQLTTGQNAVVDLIIKRHPLDQVKPIAELPIDRMIDFMQERAPQQTAQTFVP